MAKTIIFDLGGVLVHLDWDNVCTPLARLSAQSYSDIMAEIHKLAEKEGVDYFPQATAAEAS